MASGWLALFLPGGTEVAGNGYARVSTSSGDWTILTGGMITNATTITFPAPTAPWGTIAVMALMTASSGGTALYRAKVTDDYGKPFSVEANIASFFPGTIIFGQGNYTF